MPSSLLRTAQYKKRKRLGQTIVEVIIATGVVGLVMTAVVAVVTVSVRNASRAKAKALGTKYTQEGIEYFRAQKNLMGWESFVGAIQEGGSTPTYCLATLPYTQNGGLENLPNRPCQASEFVDSNDLYQRSANVTLGVLGGQDAVTVTVTTTWEDGDRMTESTATVEFQQSQP
ncbi:hypothetical protein H3C66_04235 [Patescibacteria group bacterium]|nr:hypothetical protein [Patescibacteria group bacterium]